MMGHAKMHTGLFILWKTKRFSCQAHVRKTFINNILRTILMKPERKFQWRWHTGAHGSIDRVAGTVKITSGRGILKALNSPFNLQLF